MNRDNYQSFFDGGKGRYAAHYDLTLIISFLVERLKQLGVKDEPLNLYPDDQRCAAINAMTPHQLSQASDVAYTTILQSLEVEDRVRQAIEQYTLIAERDWLKLEYHERHPEDDHMEHEFVVYGDRCCLRETDATLDALHRILLRKSALAQGDIARIREETKKLQRKLKALEAPVSDVEKTHVW